MTDRHFSWIEENNPSEIDKLQFFDEDFADNFSSKVMNSLGFNGPQYNLGCLLFGLSNESGNRTRYFGNGGSHPLLVREKEANHSARLFRLLQVGQDLGHTTPICERFAEQEDKNIYFSNGIDILHLPNVVSCEQ